LVWREFVARFLPAIVFVVIAIIALIFWRQRLSPASILGEAETIHAVINATDTGVLTELSVRSFQQVKPGELLGKIVVNDPKVPLPLVSPIEGAVTCLHAAVGDKVKVNTPVITITGNKPDRIIAFIRQPISFVPEEGAPVEVRPRARHSGTISAAVQRVGLQLAPIPATLLPLAAARRENPHTEYGLPVIVSVPSELKLFPGEIVELTLLAKPVPPTPPLPPPAPKTNAPPPVATNTTTTAAPVKK
jgi:pyruvate/2-oxoglutarate dehydrogenase complex dihydrolipoamide acyltransferase (E2) component